jgi:hypothetical protein
VNKGFLQLLSDNYFQKGNIMKKHNAFLACSAAVLALASFPAMAATGMQQDRINTNITQRDCTDLPIQQRSLTPEEFRRRTDYCNQMRGQTKGSAISGKDSAAITSPGPSNPNAPNRSFDTSRYEDTDTNYGTYSPSR